MTTEVIDFLLLNHIEIKATIKPNLDRIIKNKTLFLPFEYKERIKEQVNKHLTSFLMDKFDLNIEDAMVTLDDDKLQPLLDNYYYDDFKYLG